MQQVNNVDTQFELSLINLANRRNRRMNAITEYQGRVKVSREYNSQYLDSIGRIPDNVNSIILSPKCKSNY